MRIEDARGLFTGLRDKTFLDAACVSLVPSTARDAMLAFIDMAMTCPARDASLHHIAMDEWRQRTIGELATLFGVAPPRLALVESTTHGLNIAASAIPFEAGDEVLIADTEFLQVAIPFSRKQQQGLLRIVPVPSAESRRLTLGDLEARLTRRTRAVCVSSVQWCTGQRLPMKALGALCRDRGIWLIVDGVHEAGALRVDLGERFCDFYIAGGHKWLNAPFGCGVMVLSHRAMELEPPSHGYLALEAPRGGWGAYFQDPAQTPYRDYRFPASAKTFEIAGTSNYPGAIGLAEAVKIVNAVGIDAIEARVLHLARFLRQKLRQAGLAIVNPDDPGADSGITVFQLPQGIGQELELLERLLDERIYVSVRYTSGLGGIRVSTHYYNTEDEISTLCDRVERFVRQG